MKLGEIARESRETYSGDKTGIPIVGLEHLVSQELRFTDYDIDTDNTFTKRFHKGQILFGRRRAYLKKAAIADFDGICSGDITVIEAIPGKVDPMLLPFIIQNDRLFDYAISHSAGGLSPRVKWADLADYEFDLPSPEEQRRLADKLWAAYELKEAYKKMIAATDEMVKAQFIEMFKGHKCLPYQLGNYVSIKTGKLDANAASVDGAYPFFTCGTETLKIDRYAFDCEAVLLAGNGEFCVKYYNGKFNAYQRTYVIESLDKKVLSVPFLFVWLQQYAIKLKENAIGGVIKYIKMGDLTNAPIPIPEITEQNQYVEIAEQAEQSKSELRQAIEKIDRVMKSLMQ